MTNMGEVLKYALVGGVKKEGLLKKLAELLEHSAPVISVKPNGSKL